MRTAPIYQGFPLHVERNSHGLLIETGEIPVCEFHDPFCQETIARFDWTAKSKWFVSRKRLTDVSKTFAGQEPAGIIFHVARCGSTLAANLLRQQPDIAVYSEPPAVNDVLLPPLCWSRDEHIAALRIVGGLLVRHAQAAVVLKLRSWNTLYADIITSAFPCSPWAFILRDPVEVGVSVLRKPPTWLRALSAPQNPFLSFIGTHSIGREEYVARMFAAFCDAVASVDASRGIVLDYNELPSAVWNILVPHFGLWTSANERRRMAEVGRNYSKDPVDKTRPFQADSLDKQRESSPALRLTTHQYALPALDRLMCAFRSQTLCT